MIPQKPHHFEKYSLEDIMFDSLKLLSDNYYIFHSFKINKIYQGVLYESETDFIIFNPQKGLLCIEAKAGKVSYHNGDWYYASGIKMEHGGPFDQASSNKWKLKKYIDESNYRGVLQKLKMLHAVWFPSINEEDLRKITLPSNADMRLVLTKAAIENPEIYICNIFKTELPNHIETNLSEVEAKKFIENILCPAFNIFPSASLDIDIKKIAFHRLLREQAGILNFLEDQRIAVINGVAGTGKTMIAIEKAKRHAMKGQKVLFLCFNNQLKIFLSKQYKHENIDYFTIDGLACKLCDTSVANYKKLKNELEDMYLSNRFEYQHIIIDEGQDFGNESIEEADMIQLLEDIINDNVNQNTTFYIFYDKLQLIQSGKIPKYISEADCKLTLYKNCRNTENIATTSMKPLAINCPKLFDGCVKGLPTKMHFWHDEIALVDAIDKSILIFNNDGIKDIVVLTCKTEEKSVIFPYCRNGFYNKKIKFSTCRKFKGLEADAIILIDVDSETFSEKNVLLYYVGASRARFRLDIFTNLSDAECRKIYASLKPESTSPKKPQKDLATALNSIYEAH
ncbi:MAG: NERD domain-containing protein [Clostridia bacterium]